jgi:UDP-glucose 4-epimerase
VSDAPLLVTGATGMIGRTLLGRLGGRPVAALARSGAPDWAAEHPGVTWIEADLTDAGFAGALPAELEGIVHLAQSESDGKSADGALDVFEVNTESTARLLDHAGEAGARSFVLASTATVYRHSPDPIAEDGHLDSSSPYAVSKANAEMLLAPYSGLMDALALRFFTAYGRPQPGRLIWELTRKVREGKPVQVQGERGLLLSPIHADDVATAILAALDRDAGPGLKTLNVGGAEALGIREIAEAIAEAAGTEAVLEQVDGPEPGGLVADRTRSVTELRLPDPISFRDGIERLLSAESPA